MTSRTFAVVSSLLLAVAAVPAVAGDFSYDIEAGYQWVDVTGNEDMYRTQVNQEDGFVLGDLSILSIEPDGGFYDRLRLDASGFGGNPSGRLAFDLGLGTVYNLQLRYLQASRFSALPEHANPFAEDGVVPGQHTFDRDQDMLHLQVELFPGRMVTPILGYRWNRIEGPLNTTYHVGQDEFQLRSELEQTEDEYYVGLAFHAGDFRGALTQGWRTYESTDRLELIPGGAFGNNSNEVLGVDVNLDDFTRTTTTEADTPVTNFTVNGRLTDKVEMRVLYARADAESETSSSELLSGSLVSYRINRYFAGLDESIAAATDSPSWRGELDFSFAFSEFVNADLNFTERRLRLDGWAMVSTLFQDTLSFSGLDTADISRMATISTASERDESAVDFRLGLASAEPVSFWVDGAVIGQSITLDEDLAQIIVPVGQEGAYDREIQRYGMGTVVKVGRGRVSLDFQNESADEVVMRTDFTSRAPLRLRFQQPIGERVDLAGTFEKIDADNLGSDVNYDASTDHRSLDLSIRPADQLTFVITWDDYTTESSIMVRMPQDFSLEPSVFVDEGGLIEGRMELDLNRLDITAAYTKLENDGTLAFGLDRFFARVSFDLCSFASAALELDNYHYDEDLFSAAGFDSTRYAVLFRLHN